MTIVNHQFTKFITLKGCYKACT